MDLEVQPLPIVLTGVAIVGDSEVELVGKYRYGCLGKYSDGTERDLDDCLWIMENPDIVNAFLIEDTLDIRALGTVHLTASYGGFSGTLSVRLTGTPWSELDPLPETDRKWIQQNAMNSLGMI